MFIGISGKRGVGKNYIMEHHILPYLIQNLSNENEQYVPYFFSFGTQPKIDLYSRDSNDLFTYDNLFDAKTYDTRKAIVEYATEMGRNKIRPDVWIRCVEMWCEVQMRLLEVVNSLLVRKMKPIFVIEDVRFENEYQFLRSKNAIMILVEAPLRNQKRIIEEGGNPKEEQHISEKGLEHLEFDIRISNNPNDNIDIVNNESFKKIIFYYQLEGKK